MVFTNFPEDFIPRWSQLYWKYSKSKQTPQYTCTVHKTKYSCTVNFFKKRNLISIQWQIRPNLMHLLTLVDMIQFSGSSTPFLTLQAAIFKINWVYRLGCRFAGKSQVFSDFLSWTPIFSRNNHFMSLLRCCFTLLNLFLFKFLQEWWTLLGLSFPTLVHVYEEIIPCTVALHSFCILFVAFFFQTQLHAPSKSGSLASLGFSQRRQLDRHILNYFCTPIHNPKQCQKLCSWLSSWWMQINYISS